MTIFVIVLTINAIADTGFCVAKDAWLKAGINAAIAGWGVYLLVRP